MSEYRHKKGVIKHNALEALMSDPLFKMRVEVNHKGKGSYRRKEKHVKKGGWEAKSKFADSVLTSGLPSFMKKIAASTGCRQLQAFARLFF